MKCGRSLALVPRVEAALHVGSVEAADRRGHVGRAAGGWGGECGS